MSRTLFLMEHSATYWYKSALSCLEEGDPAQAKEFLELALRIYARYPWLGPDRFPDLLQCRELLAELEQRLGQAGGEK